MNYLKFSSSGIQVNLFSVHLLYKQTFCKFLPSLPHAGWRYKANVTLSGKKVGGHVLISLFGNKGNSKQYEIFK